MEEKEEKEEKEEMEGKWKGKGEHRMGIWDDVLEGVNESKEDR